LLKLEVLEELSIGVMDRREQRHFLAVQFLVPFVGMEAHFKHGIWRFLRRRSIIERVNQ
jgi:hypothetical protein